MKMYSRTMIVDRINKLTVGRKYKNEITGTVKCIQTADGVYGARRFSVSKSPYLKSGKYSLRGLKERIAAYI